MTEVVNGSRNWIEGLKPPQTSQIVFIRHGESKYTGNGSDLTTRGVEQIANTARRFKDYLTNFDSVIVLTSPAPRARTSSEVFIENSGISPEITKESQSIRPFDMKNLSGFLKYDEGHSTPIYGQMWLSDEFLSDENPLTESRHNVERRSARFLYHYGKVIDRVARETGKKMCVLVFTHMEVGVNFLQGIYPTSKSFPVEFAPVLENGEPVIVQLDNPRDDSYTIMARGAVSRVKYDNSDKHFTKID